MFSFYKYFVPPGHFFAVHGVLCAFCKAVSMKPRKLSHKSVLCLEGAAHRYLKRQRFLGINTSTFVVQYSLFVILLFSVHVIKKRLQKKSYIVNRTSYIVNRICKISETKAFLVKRSSGKHIPAFIPYSLFSCSLIHFFVF